MDPGVIPKGNAMSKNFFLFKKNRIKDFLSLIFILKEHEIMEKNKELILNGETFFTLLFNNII